MVRFAFAVVGAVRPTRSHTISEYVRSFGRAGHKSPIRDRCHVGGLRRIKEDYSKLPVKMIKQTCDLRRRVDGGAAAAGFK